MKNISICAFVVVLSLATVVVQAQVVLVEDFEAYTADTSIHLQGDDGGIPRWYAQRNGGAGLADHGWSNVRDFAGNQVLEIINRDVGGEVDTSFTSMAVWTHKITDMGTVYIQFLSKTPTNCLLATNDLWAGYGDYSLPELGVQAGYQPYGSGAWSASASLVRLSGDADFYGRDGGSYPTHASYNVGWVSGQWNEVWMQIDVGNQRCKYFVAVNGGAIEQMYSDGVSDEWWAYRNLDRDAVENLSFFSGANGGVETLTLVDHVAIDSSAWSTNRFPLPPVEGDEEPCIPGDADCDGDVDLDDFVALKVGFGSGTTWAEGDFDEDGDVDLDDFVILKTNFGAVAQ